MPEADYLFREALRSEGVGPVRSWMFWTGVSFGRFVAYQQGVAIAAGRAGCAVGVLGLHALTVLSVAARHGSTGWLSGRAFWVALLGRRGGAGACCDAG